MRISARRYTLAVAARHHPGASSTWAGREAGWSMMSCDAELN
jgi:hypothetical protein